MLAEPRPCCQQGGKRRYLSAIAGGLLGVATVLALAEVWLRVAPPADLSPTKQTHGVGHFVADPEHVLSYRCLAALLADNPQLPDGWWDDLRRDPRPAWLLFGNSFVQMQGMLGDQVAQQLPQVHAIYLRKNEYLPVRAAQLRLLLEEGLRPERVLFVLLPIDAVGFLVEPPEQYHIDASGVLTIQTPIPDWIAPLADKSRLAYAFAVRTHDAKRAYTQAANRLASGLAGQDRTELAWLVHELAATCRHYGIPLSLVLLPNYEQIYVKQSLALQGDLRCLATAEDLDVLQIDTQFLADPDKPTLFIPDKHFSPRGNRILLAAVAQHFGMELH